MNRRLFLSFYRQGLMTDHILSVDEDLEEDAAVYVLAPDSSETGMRLDQFLAARLPDASRTFLQRVIREGNVRVDGVPRKQTFKVTAGQTVHVELPEIEETALVPEPMDLDILYEDEDILVLNKPAGLVVHPAPGNTSGTLVNGLLHYLPDLRVGGVNRPGIVHRLDKDTSGVMVVAISDRGHVSLTEQWARRSVEKRYLTLVRGEVDVPEGTIDVPIGRNPADRLRMAPLATGKPAITHFTVLERFAGATLLEVELVTGRTHQIRVHMAFIGHPVVGDPVYNRKAGVYGGTEAVVARQFLHASRLAFIVPSTGRRQEFEAPLAADLASALRKLRGIETSASDA